MQALCRTAMAMFILVASGLASQDADLQRGIALYNTQKYAEAEQVLTQAVQAEDGNAQAHEYLGLVYLSVGKLDQASAELLRADELSPSSDSIKIGLARLYIESKQFDKAEEFLKNAQQINGENPDIPLYSGALKVAQRDFQGAISDLNQAIARKSDNAYAHYYAGLAYNALKRPDKMVESFQTFLKLAPNAPEADRVRSLLRSVR
jgi:tetratricopeptide (TPR) repeat protein